VSPQSNQIVVLLVEGDPGEGHLCFFYLTPVGKERRLPVAGRGAYDTDFAVQAVPETSEQLATDQLLGARRWRPQLGLEYDPRRIYARVARGVNNGILSPAPLSSAAHVQRRADERRLYTQDEDLHKSYSITFDDFNKPHVDL
jgi:hypothetical protein